MQRDHDEAGRPDLSGWLGRMHAAPWEFGFTTLLRQFGAMHADLPRIGLASRPQQEPFRLGQTAALTFAPREIAEVMLPTAPDAKGLADIGKAASRRGGNNPTRPLVRLFGLGLLGPNGPLPLHYTETVRERVENNGDSTLADFLDIFHHRYLTHLYRAWAQSQAAAGLDRVDDETFSRYLARLTGHDPLEIRDSVLPDHARMAASVHLSREARSPDGLAATLANFFGVPVELQEFVMHWIRIDEEDQCHLGAPRTSSIVGVGALLGEVVADRQSKFRIVLGPLRLDQYVRFTPRGRDLPQLVEWVRGFIGYEFVWELELRVRIDNAPATRLEDKERLGWSTWLGGGVSTATHVPAPVQGAGLGPAESAGSDYAVGMLFEPEQYLLSRSAATPANSVHTNLAAPPQPSAFASPGFASP